MNTRNLLRPETLFRFLLIGLVALSSGLTATRAESSSTNLPRIFIDSVAASRVRTTCRPAAALVRGVAPDSTHCAKCLISTASASVVSSRGAHMSPVR